MSRTTLITSICLVLFSLPIITLAQTESTQEEATGLPGDGFSLEGALELFKQAATMEEFEKLLNTEENYVNNLDLNEDGDIDFIRVQDHMEGEVHAIVLQVPLNKKESQDIAVIELEKTGKEEATLQIIGDEDLYGEQVIIEPSEVKAESIGKGPNAEVVLTRIIVNVWAWPCVRFVYRPNYRVYVSPWYWGYYPVTWWRPWRPRPWSVCHSYRVRVYRPHFRIATTHRVVRAHRVYTPHRRTTTVVRTRTTTAVATNKRTGKVVQGNRVVSKKITTTKVAKTNKGTVATKKTTTGKAAKGRNGQVGAKRTTTTKKAATNGKKRVGQKKTKTTAVKKGNRGRAAGKKTTTTRRKKG